MKNIQKVGNRSKKRTYEEDLSKGRKPGLLVNFGKFWISKLHDLDLDPPSQNTDPDPGQPNECRSMRVRIHNLSVDPYPKLDII
jgi:hypothetical protein